MSTRDYSLYAHCRICGENKELKVNQVDYASWQSGTLIQRAFPYLSADDRELLISQTCGSCWDKMFG